MLRRAVFFMFILPLAFFLLPAARPVHAALSTVDAIKARGVLLRGSDAEGGAPYVFPDPKDPSDF